MTDEISNQRLANVHPLLAAKVNAAAEALERDGIYFRVAQGLRSYAEQNALPRSVTNAKGGYSWHNFGCAVDCYPFLTGATGELNWNAESEQFQAMVAALKNQGLVWGGDWKSIKDPPHFQLSDVPVTPTDSDRGMLASGGLLGVWRLYPGEEDTRT